MLTLGKPGADSFGRLQRLRLRRVEISHERRSGRLRSAGWLAAHRLASMLRRRGFHPLREPSEKRGPWQTRQRRKRPYRSGDGNRRKGLAVSSALKNRPGSQVLRLRNITVFRVYEGFDQAALLTSRRWEVCDWPYQRGRCGHRPSAPTRPTPRRRRSYDGVRRMTKDGGQSEGP
jgi:hypothetical protein